MALKIYQECDMSGKTVPVTVTGTLDPSSLPLPEGWERRNPLPGGNVGPQDEMILCPEALPIYDQALKDGENARDRAYETAMGKARSVASNASGASRKTSSFAGV